jgi:uncharacterized protein (DUF2267 family)
MEDQPMDATHLTALVAERAGIEPASAASIIEATLGALAERLLDLDARAIATRLPPSWAAHFARGGDGDFEPEGLYTRVHLRTDLTPGQALERSQVVLQVLAEALDETGRKHLELHLTDSWRALFVPRAVSAPPFALHGASRRRVVPGVGTTLASGHPGPRHPLSSE